MEMLPFLRVYLALSKDPAIVGIFTFKLSRMLSAVLFTLSLFSSWLLPRIATLTLASRLTNKCTRALCSKPWLSTVISLSSSLPRNTMLMPVDMSTFESNFSFVDSKPSAEATSL